MTKNTVLAYIPARASSKRIPNKNIRNFLGKPLIVYAIKQALACAFVDRVMVDTDSKKIAKISKKYGAEAPFLRPRHLATDTAKLKDALFHFLARLKKEENYAPDYIMILQTTSPLREKKDILDCWRMAQKIKANTVLTVCPTHPKLYHLDKNNFLKLVNGSEKKSNNTQTWPAGYILNGCFVYIVKTKAFLKEKNIITKNTKAIICDKWRSVDLDTPEEWALAEILYKNKKTIASRIKKI
ncbi:MAG: acylneuraminate cytidylyltransferase family protein [Patescibacteria group bacterium]|nr:acylneuraminate cytidylyltransferase family protein [Patescibacteria group bacterium]